MRAGVNNINCKDYECYTKGNLKKCLKCKKGKVFVVCPHCYKMYPLKSKFLRIDCDCSGGFIPCYDICEFINEKLMDKYIGIKMLKK